MKNTGFLIPTDLAAFVGPHQHRVDGDPDHSRVDPRLAAGVRAGMGVGVGVRPY